MQTINEDGKRNAMRSSNFELPERNYCPTTGKTCYTQREANGVINFYKSGHKWSYRGKNIPKRSYYCNFCGTYHITHFKKKR